MIQVVEKMVSKSMIQNYDFLARDGMLSSKRLKLNHVSYMLLTSSSLVSKKVHTKLDNPERGLFADEKIKNKKEKTANSFS